MSNPFALNLIREAVYKQAEVYLELELEVW